MRRFESRGAAVAIDTKAVLGRRNLHFQALDELVADAEMLVAAPSARTLGNWPLGQLLAHLATAINSSIDGISAKAPWYLRLIGPFLKGRVLRNKMAPGFNIPREIETVFFPAVSSVQQGLQSLRTAVARLQSERMTARHPILGKLTHDEWRQLHLRHAELHLSFAVLG